MCFFCLKYLKSLSLIIALGFVVVIEGKQDCLKIIQPHSMACCKNLAQLSEHLYSKSIDETAECLELMKPPPSCAMDICIAKKSGLGSPANDGTFIKSKVIADLRQTFEKSPKLMQRVRKNCVEGDLSRYGPPEYCDLMKLRHCLQVHLLEQCNDWETSERCESIRTLMKKCTM